MMSRYFPGRQLEPPKLRFDPSSTAANHHDARSGLLLYGPYDSKHLWKDKVSAVLIYPKTLQRASAILRDGLLHGNEIFNGFQKFFRIPLEFIAELPTNVEDESAIRAELKITLTNYKPDIILFLTSTKNQNIYATMKAESLGNGIPSQVVTAEKLGLVQQLPWALANIALQIYAKIGGTPWTVMSAFPQKKELVLGMSRALDRQRNMVVGFVTIFTFDGDYQFLYSLSPKPAEWSKLDEYRDSLTTLIVEAYKEYSDHYGQLDSLVIHLCKRPGKYREVAAVERALSKVGNNVRYALIHLNDDGNFRLFDTGHSTYIPLMGIEVDLTQNRALLFLDGRTSDASKLRRKRGVPRVLEVVMDRRSTIDACEFPRLVQQVFEFSRVNWRGFNAQYIPATLEYSYLIARLVAEIGADRWNAIASSGSLRDKAWFL